MVPVKRFEEFEDDVFCKLNDISNTSPGFVTESPSPSISENNGHAHN